ncbi:aminopeptidase [Zongyangia hominis]|uniref:Aminopeptidase n=1 Tax=Zongyangia hominis TaxID=2763677 RepID=A0A926EDJ3_9FIRM|nr:aminopeptidase [Zongyangia hominis]MBC8571105.1 aminopeptidase [Zongyangia hominis]
MTLAERAKKILVDCMGVREGEQVLIVTDDVKEKIGRSLYEAARSLGAEALLMQMGEREVSGQEPPSAVAQAMKAADVVLAPTAKSLTHTNARIAAVKAGARIATMPDITEAMFEGGAMCADYGEVERLTLKLTEMLTQAKSAKIVKDGRTLTLSLEGRKGIPSTGVYKQPGQAGNLPSGEAYIAPREDGCEGEMCIDGSMVGVGLLDEPLYVKIEDGKLKEITGKHSDKVAFLTEDEHSATVGELGIGTNRGARLCGAILEDEKVYGTVHIAFGTNTSFGGVNKASCHLDGVITAPDLYLDGRLVLSRGAFVEGE